MKFMQNRRTSIILLAGIYALYEVQHTAMGTMHMVILTRISGTAVRKWSNAKGEKWDAGILADAVNGYGCIAGESMLGRE